METNYGSTLPFSFLNTLSPGEQQLYGEKFRLDVNLDETYQPSENSSFPAAVGFGFAQSPGIGGRRLAEPVLVLQAHVRYVGHDDAHPLSLLAASPAPTNKNTVTV